MITNLALRTVELDINLYYAVAGCNALQSLQSCACNDFFTYLVLVIFLLVVMGDWGVWEGLGDGGGS